MPEGVPIYFTHQTTADLREKDADSSFAVRLLALKLASGGHSHSLTSTALPCIVCCRYGYCTGTSVRSTQQRCNDMYSLGWRYLGNEECCTSGYLRGGTGPGTTCSALFGHGRTNLTLNGVSVAGQCDSTCNLCSWTKAPTLTMSHKNGQYSLAHPMKGLSGLTFGKKVDACIPASKDHCYTIDVSGTEMQYRVAWMLLDGKGQTVMRGSAGSYEVCAGGCPARHWELRLGLPTSRRGPC